MMTDGGALRRRAGHGDALRRRAGDGDALRRCAGRAAVGALMGTLISGAAAAQGIEALDCVIEASEVAEVSSSVRGIISAVHVERGDQVEKGQVLARLESSVEEATVNLARARAESVNEINAREARVELAQKQVRRVRDLRRTDSVASQALDEAETELVLAQIALDQAHEEQRIAALELERAERMLDLRTIRSPVSGVVVEIYSSASESSIEERPIMRIARIDPLHVEAIAPVDAFGTIEAGTVATVLPEEPVGGEFTATVSLVDRIIDASSGTFGIRLELPNPDGALPAGLRCRLRFPDSAGPPAG